MNKSKFMLLNRLRLLIVALSFLWVNQLIAQEHISKVISSGGGYSYGGNFSNFSVVGGEPVASNISGENYSSSIGFIYTSYYRIPSIMYTITYSASEGGIIVGETYQTVYQGADGSTVEAVPDACHVFLEWSDGITNNPRTDRNVTSDIAVTAIFLPRNIDVTVTVTENSLIANNTNATYQWINCVTNQPVEGATEQIFTPTSSGEYAVIITDQGCSLLSDCNSISLTSISTLQKDRFNFRVYPNPSKDFFTVVSSFGGDFTIYNSMGFVVKVFKINDMTGFSMRIEGLTTGIYFVVGRNGTKLMTQKVVVY